MDTLTPACTLMLQAHFGGHTGWRNRFKSLAGSITNNTGKVVMFFDPARAVVDLEVSDSATASPPGRVSLLELLPASPSAAGEDGSAARSTAVDLALDRVNWAEVYAHYQAAVNTASEPYAASLDDVEGATLLDVRRAGVYKAALQIIPGAQWRDPAAVAQWAANFPASKPVLVYCVYGHEVSRAVMLKLRATGVPARYIAGGIDGWASAGKPLAAKPTEQPQ